MKTILLIYYNQKSSSFYFKFCYPIDLLLQDKSVGYKNSYGHELISILFFQNNTYIPIYSFDDYYSYSRPIPLHKSFRNDLIDKGIHLLNKLKK